MVRATGPLPVAFASAAEVSIPVELSMEYTETAFEPVYTTYKNRPFGSTASATGAVPDAANGEPLTGVRAPVEESIEYADRLLESWFATYAKCPACVHDTSTLATLAFA